LLVPWPELGGNSSELDQPWDYYKKKNAISGRKKNNVQGPHSSTSAKGMGGALRNFLFKEGIKRGSNRGITIMLIGELGVHCSPKKGKETKGKPSSIKTEWEGPSVGEKFSNLRERGPRKGGAPKQRKPRF